MTMVKAKFEGAVSMVPSVIFTSHKATLCSLHRAMTQACFKHESWEQLHRTWRARECLFSLFQDDGKMKLLYKLKS